MEIRPLENILKNTLLLYRNLYTKLQINIYFNYYLIQRLKNMQYLIKISLPRQCCALCWFCIFDIKDPINWSPFVRNKEPDMAPTEADLRFDSEVVSHCCGWLCYDHFSFIQGFIFECLTCDTKLFLTSYYIF